MKTTLLLTALAVASLTAFSQSAPTLDQKLLTLRAKQEQAAGVELAQKREQLATALRTAESDPEVKALVAELRRVSAAGPGGNTRAFMEQQDTLGEQLARKHFEKAAALQPALKAFAQATLDHHLALKKLLQENMQDSAARQRIIEEIKASVPAPQKETK